MKREFIRSKRQTNDYFAPLKINVQKKMMKQGNGLVQVILNVIVYIIIFLLFLKII